MNESRDNPIQVNEPEYIKERERELLLEEHEIKVKEKKIDLQTKELERKEKEIELHEREWQIQAQKERSTYLFKREGREHWIRLFITSTVLIAGIWLVALDKDIGYWLLGTGGASGSSLLSDSSNHEDGSRKKEKNKKSLEERD